MKGTKIYVEGKLKKRSWQDKEGVTRYSTEVVGDEMTILSKIENKENNAAPIVRKPTKKWCRKFKISPLKREIFYLLI